MNLVENKKYSIYGVVEDINDSLAETFSVVFRLNEKEKIILRFQNEYKEIISIGNILHVDGIAKQYKSKIHLYVNNFKDLDYMDIEAKEKERIRYK